MESAQWPPSCDPACGGLCYSVTPTCHNYQQLTCLQSQNNGACTAAAAPLCLCRYHSEIGHLTLINTSPAPALALYMMDGNNDPSSHLMLFFTLLLSISQSQWDFRKCYKVFQPRNYLQSLFVAAVDYCKYVSHSFLFDPGLISVHFSSNQEKCIFLSHPQCGGHLPGRHGSHHVASSLHLPPPPSARLPAETAPVQAVPHGDAAEERRGDWGRDPGAEARADQEQSFIRRFAKTSQSWTRPQLLGLSPSWKCCKCES